MGARRVREEQLITGPCLNRSSHVIVVAFSFSLFFGFAMRRSCLDPARLLAVAFALLNRLWQASRRGCVDTSSLINTRRSMTGPALGGPWILISIPRMPEAAEWPPSEGYLASIQR